MDRVHRIGQIRPVRVIRFIVKNSIEERFIDVQDAKEALAKGSMERLKKKDRRKANVRIKALPPSLVIRRTEMAHHRNSCPHVCVCFAIRIYRSADYCAQGSFRNEGSGSRLGRDVRRRRCLRRWQRSR